MPESNEYSVRMHFLFQSRVRIVFAAFTIGVSTLIYGCSYLERERPSLKFVSTIAGIDNSIGEPFGIAVRGRNIYISDGEKGEIYEISPKGGQSIQGGLDTPSGIAFSTDGKLLVVDTGRNTIYRMDPSPSPVAGQGERGFRDGPVSEALFNGPMGIAVANDGKIYISDTYNDRIRVIENDQVRTLAGSTTGFSDGTQARFNTPTGLALWQDKLLVADTGNNRIRVVEPDGSVWTLAGNGASDLVNGSLLSASFVQPTGITVDPDGSIYVTDGNAVRKIGGALPIVTTLNNGDRGTRDGSLAVSRFNRPSGIAIDDNGDLIIADSENRLVRRVSANKGSHEITSEEIAARRDKPEDFRNAQPARWPYDPPNAKRDIAGTLGEVRGLVTPETDQIWFHNGLDIAGSYGETARFVRTEKVLKPIAAENFNTLRELVRMPTLGYIHIRIGRDASGNLFDDPRFQFERDTAGKLMNVRVPRGAKFNAGDRIGTLNSMNHVHLIAGRSGSEMNALDALILPGISDSRPPVIEKVTLFDANWREIETPSENTRITLRDRIRIIVTAFDQVDGNNARRRLGLYRVWYQLFRGDASVSTGPAAEIKFDRTPPNEAVKFVYANGSHSGATGETIFNYIATNSVEADNYREGFLDPSQLESGTYILRVSAADYFGNTTTRDLSIEVIK